MCVRIRMRFLRSSYRGSQRGNGANGRGRRSGRRGGCGCRRCKGRRRVEQQGLQVHHLRQEQVHRVGRRQRHVSLLDLLLLLRMHGTLQILADIALSALLKVLLLLLLLFLLLLLLLEKHLFVSFLE